MIEPAAPGLQSIPGAAQRKENTVRSPLDRFRAFYVTDESGCWLWVGYVRPNGYGQFRPGGSLPPAYAHRWSYEQFVRPLMPKQVVDHLCRVRHCVNPEHLEAVDQRTNLLRGQTIPARLATRTHCDNGHEFTADNSYTNTDGTRRCRTCKNAYQQRAYWRRKAR